MKRIPYTNDGDTAKYVAGILIPPGETRLVDALQVSAPVPMDDAPEAPPPVPTEDVLVAILDGSVKDITEALPALTLEQLDTLELAEQGGKTRKGVIEALAAARIALAQTPPPAE